MELFIGFCLFYSAGALQCIQSTDGSGEAELCDDFLANRCKKPLFVDYVGLSDTSYGCGECASEEDGLTCSECDVDGCNKPAEVEVGENFKCFDYKWEATNEVWVIETNLTSCQRLKDTDIKCNMPGTAADADYSFPHNGCGPCATDAADDICVECDTEKCNEESSATTITATLLPLITVIYSLVM